MAAGMVDPVKFSFHLAGQNLFNVIHAVCTYVYTSQKVFLGASAQQSVI